MLLERSDASLHGLLGFQRLRLHHIPGMTASSGIVVADRSRYSWKWSIKNRSARVVHSERVRRSWPYSSRVGRLPARHSLGYTRAGIEESMRPGHRLSVGRRILHTTAGSCSRGSKPNSDRLGARLPTASAVLRCGGERLDGQPDQRIGLVYELTDSPLGAHRLGPRHSRPVGGGLIADRVDRKQFIMVQLASALANLLLAGSTDAVQMAHLPHLDGELVSWPSAPPPAPPSRRTSCQGSFWSMPLPSPPRPGNWPSSSARRWRV